MLTLLQSWNERKIVVNGLSVKGNWDQLIKAGTSDNSMHICVQVKAKFREHC